MNFLVRDREMEGGLAALFGAEVGFDREEGREPDIWERVEKGIKFSLNAHMCLSFICRFNFSMVKLV